MWALRSPLILLLCLLTWDDSSGQSELRPPTEKFAEESDNEAQLHTGSSEWVHRKVSSGSTDLDIFWAESAESTRSKRSTLNTEKGTWPHDIPYVFDASFRTVIKEYLNNVAPVPIGKPATQNASYDQIPMLKKSIHFIESHVCVTFHDVNNTFNESDPHWFTKHGYETDSYIRIGHHGGCSAPNGRGSGSGPRRASPCYGFGPNVHEMLHTLGAIHGHNFPDRDQYITINLANISPGQRSAYSKIHPAITTYTYIDLLSDMTYADNVWSSNGFETYFPIRDDLFDVPVQFSSENILFMELNEVYTCAETFCKNDSRDCGSGYMALESGVCRCVCPVDLDPATNCSTQINGPNQFIAWSKAPMVLLAAGDSCPKGFNEGWIPLPGTGPAVQEPSPYRLPQAGNVTYLHLCSKTSPSDPAQQDWMSWPSGGHYSVVKSKGLPCGGAFEEGTIEFHTPQTSHPNGSAGDVQVSGNKVTVKFCTKKLEPTHYPINLPSGEPFALISNRCPRVVGMIGVRSVFTLHLDGTKATGTQPSNEISSHTFKSYQCSYIPPKYGCNQAVRLDKSNPSVTFTTPGWGGDREPSRRCFYRFEGPKDSKLRVTFNTYDVHPLDMVLYRRHNTWQEPAAVNNYRSPAQLLSVGDFLLLEWWSWYEKSPKKGMNFTVDVIFPEDFCYDQKRNGSDYIGQKSVSEEYEECVPWGQAVNCSDFPFIGSLNLIDNGNQCRNPGGELLQPWCYTYVNGSVCQKRYCDVCNFLAPDDVLTDCAQLIAADPEFCKTAIERTACFKSCQLPTQNYKKSCPDQWLSHNDRCLQIFTTNLKQPEALKACKSYSDSGTLFQIRNETDQNLVNQYRRQRGGDFQASAWISGQLFNKQWVFTDTNISMPYHNFSRKDAMFYGPWDCVRLKTGMSWFSDRGAWRNDPCKGNYTANYICQVDSAVTCGPLPVPDDGIPLNYDPNKKYIEGDQVPIVCKNASSMPVFSACTANGWTKVKRACGSCAFQWLSHEDRCFRIFTNKLKQPDALKECKSYADSGTLFQIRNEADQNLLKEYQHQSAGHFEDSAWISGQLINKQWVFTDTNISMPYHNFSRINTMFYGPWDCARLKSEYGWFSDSGAWRNDPCRGSYTADYICQVDSAGDHCDDLEGNCEAILGIFPYFCHETHTLAHSHQLCQRTCGGCHGTPQCKDPKSTTYTRTSSNESINTGEVMTFACNSGLYHVSGNLTRACSSTGKLLGAEPVCQSTPVAQDIQLARIRKRRDSLPWHYAFLLDHEGYRIPFDGKVTKWYYYCGRFGHLDFIVYRKIGGSYHFVGTNNVDCTPGWKRTYNVPPNQRIALKKGDVFGVYSPDRALSVIMCTRSADKVLVVPFMKAYTFAGVKGASHPFTKTICVVPSLAIRVEP